VNTSINKAISYTDEESRQKCFPESFHPKCLQTSAILTVLGSIPPNNGSNLLRPPYCGSQKPFFSIDDVDMSLFRRFAVPKGVSIPSVSSALAGIVRPQIDHKPNGVLVEHITPLENLPTYPPSQTVLFGHAFGRLFFNDTVNETQFRRLLAAVLQAGLDRYYAIKTAGQVWNAGSGVVSGKKWLVGVFVALLGDQTMKDHFASLTFFDENKYVVSGKDGQGLYGGSVSESTYWDRTLGSSESNQNHADPYRYIDGGGKVTDFADNYQFCCRGNPWKGGLIALKLIPELAKIWSKAPLFETYLVRIFNQGLKYQPDPCAPVEGICKGGNKNGTKCTAASTIVNNGGVVRNTVCGANGTCDYNAVKSKTFRITYGPDGNGSCIKDTDPSDGIGRFPLRQNGTLDFAYSSPAMNAIWNHYFSELFSTPTTTSTPSSTSHELSSGCRLTVSALVAACCWFAVTITIP
jgi:hypothetical protein